MARRGLSIQIVTPAPAGSRAGNRVTAQRWRAILRSLGHRVTITTAWRGEPDILVALHARRSHTSIAGFARKYPQRPLIVALTGTDLYRDIHRDRKAARSLELAWRLVVLQEDGVKQLPAALRKKVRVIHQSADPVPRRRKSDVRLRLCLAGHLRAEKDPFRAVRAMRLRPRLDVALVHAGKSLEARFAAEARRWMRFEPRYRWLGELTPSRTRQLIAGSDALVLTSILEGGANVISEAVVCDVPVLASRISSSVALLGDDYEGFFPVRDTHALAALLQRFVSDGAFRRRLRAQVRRQRARFHPREERQAWKVLVEEMWGR